MRQRFEPPMPHSADELHDQAFLALMTRAAFTDTHDREPNAGDYQYWVDAHGPELLARGVEIRYKGQGALAGLWYLWDRLIGWQATGADAAAYGPFAGDGNHPTPNTGPAAGWQTAFVDVGQVEPQPGPAPTPDPGEAAIVASLAHNIDALAGVVGELVLRVAALEATATRIDAQLQRGFRMPYFGAITPIKE